MKGTNHKFQFGNVVVVNGEDIGVIVKSWIIDSNSYFYDVYIRHSSNILNIKENNIKHYIYSKELLDDQKEFYL